MDTGRVGGSLLELNEIPSDIGRNFGIHRGDNVTESVAILIVPRLSKASTAFRLAADPVRQSIAHRSISKDWQGRGV